MEINLIRQSELWPHSLPDLRRIITQALSMAGVRNMDKPIAIVLVDDAQIQELNRDFRGKDKATNVLSFPYEEDEDLPPENEQEEEWGDIIFSYETIAREALEQGKSFDHHFTHLLVHGVLHLLGFDHIEDGEAEEMEALEVKILSELSIDNPYRSA